MEWIVPFIMVLFLAGMILLLAKLVFKTSSLIMKSRILSSGVQTKESVEALLCACFGVRNVFANIYIPIDDIDAGTRHVYRTADDIVILKTGIAVVKVVTKKGEINANDPYHWTVVIRDIYGNSTREVMDNPVRSNLACTAALAKMLRRDGCADVKIYNFVVFTSERTSINVNFDEIFYPQDAADKMAELSRDKKAMQLKSRAVRKLISGYRAQSDALKRRRAKSRVNFD